VDDDGLEPVRRLFLFLAVWGGITAAILNPSPASAGTNVKNRRPSVLLILPDQMRGQALACMGDPDVRTPYLDKLASQGVLFRNTFANTLVCCPARAIILTGKYAHRNGMVANDLRLRESESTLAEILASQGYRTGFIG
jgi:arylsulfatase A-like enzyme